MGFMQKIKDLFAVGDEDAFEEDEERTAAQAESYEKERKNALKAGSISSSKSNNYDVQRTKYSDDNDYGTDYSTKSTGYSSYGTKSTTTPIFEGDSKSLRLNRPGGGKVIPITTTTMGNEVCLMKPYSFNDSQDICDVLLSSRVAVVNLEGLDMVLAQRIIDFLSGTVYAINGKLFNISSYIFILAPQNVDISGDYAEIAEQTGFDVPVLTK